MASVAWSNVAHAEEPPAAAAPMADAPPALPPPPAELPPPPPPVTPAIEAAAKPPTATESMAATRPDVLPPIDVGAWGRIGGVFQKKSDPKSLGDWHMDNAYVELHAGGKIHKKVGITLNLNANMTNFGGADPTATPTPTAAEQLGAGVSVMDAIISFDIADEFHVWAGHLLVPVDRSNASGPFFMIPWNYPGVAVGALPKEGPSGRNNGLVVWGDIAGGKLTYLAGAFDNADIGSSPLFSGRLRLALLDPEPGFWGNGSYFGDKDLLSIGLGGQFQKHGSSTMLGGDKDYGEFNADVLFEKKIPGGGWFTAEGAYYHYNVLDGAFSDSWYALVAYATPTIGIGNLQPSVRYQGASPKGGGDKPWNLDAGLAYLIKGPALRVIANYSHSDYGSLSSNALQFGAQAIFF
ncbi:MAG TPA: hypothetical protein VHU40_15335 [Polyangia bacterium]|jgi:hypothetical protein|nr:hypothetical protein [Polyangia bacterium]